MFNRLLSLDFDKPGDLPGRKPVVWRPGRGPLIGAGAAAVAWPPLLTMAFWHPENWVPGLETDWRLLLLLLGALAVPLGLRFLRTERARTGRPNSRLGIVWRFMFYGGLLAGGLQALVAVLMVVFSWFSAGSVWQALGTMETTLLIYGVGGLPAAVLIGISYALWAGLCVAFIAFEQVDAVPDRLGLMRRDLTSN